MFRPKAITVLSGGLDSTVATAYCQGKYDIQALTFDYGQKSAQMEIQSARKICENLNIKHTVIELPWLKNLGHSALTTDEEVPQLEFEELDQKDICHETALKVWVPGRNIVFTAIATSYAEDIGAEKIIVGWDLEEAATFPDNSREFLEAYNRVLEIGSISDVIIEAPLIDKNKKEIVQLGVKIDAPIDLSYSCYMGDEEHCGVCESCMRRKRAFESVGETDKVIYKE